IIQQEATNTFNSSTRRVPAPIDLRIPVENVDYPVYNLAIVAISAALLAAGYLFLRYTRYGIWLRAVAQNRPMAAALGVPVPRVYLVTLAVCSGLAGMAGGLLLPLYSVYPTVGNDVILNAFIVVVAGGLGNFRGAAIKVGVLDDVTGVGAIEGALMRISVELVVQQTNSSGGINGHPLQVIYADPKGDATQALQSATQLAQQDNVDVLAGGIFSP